MSQTPLEVRNGTDLRRLRFQWRMSQADLASALAISQASVSLMETNKRPIEDRTLAMLRLLASRRRKAGR